MGSTGTGATGICRVVTSSQNLSAKLMALSVIEGTCLQVALSASSHATVGSTEGVPGSSGDTCCEAAGINLGEAVQQQRCQNNETDNCSREAEKNAVAKQPRERVTTYEGCTNASAASVTSGSSSIERRVKMSPRSAAPPLLAKPPVRGFHLVDLHAVVRNSVEWKHCLPKVR